MNEDHTKSLLLSYPLTYGQHGQSPRQTAMCWGFDCGDGWYKLIDELSAKVEHFNRAMMAKGEPIVQATQVKEKFGGLRWYRGGLYPDEDNYKALQEAAQAAQAALGEAAEETATYADVDRWITEACQKSEETCEQCGAPGKIICPAGWLTCVCQEHGGE